MIFSILLILSKFLGFTGTPSKAATAVFKR